LVTQGFQILRVVTLKEAAYRLENEMFAALICQDDADGSRQREFGRVLAARPFGAITPLVVLGPGPQPSERALLTSVLDQYFPMDTDPEVIAEFVSETYSLRERKVKKGALHSIPHLLCHAARMRLSGGVVMERGDEKCVVYFENGFIVFASSNRNEHRFGQFLISRKVITPGQLDEALKILKGSKKRLGRILVDCGFLKPQLLHTLLQGQIKHIVLNVFDWTEGEFYVLAEEILDPESAIARAAVGPLILEGVRYKFGEAVLSKEFEPFDSMVSLALPLDQLQKRMHLGKNELDFLNLIGSGRPIGDLLSLNSYSRRESLGLLFAFRVLGFLAFQPGVVPPARAFPTKAERTQVMDELFAKKEKGPPGRAGRPRPEAPMSPMRRTFFAGASLTAVAIAGFLTVFTFFDTQTSRRAESEEDLIARVVPTAPPTVPPTAPPTIPPAAAPVMASPSPVAEVPTALPTPPEVKVASRAPTLPELLAKAQRQKAQGLLREALRTYQRAYGMDPHHVTALLGLADIHFELDETGPAVRFYEEVKRIQPSNPRPYLALGTIHLMQNENEKARIAYEAYLAVVEANDENKARIAEVRQILSRIGR
jgi:hypothetical protein